MMNIWTLMPVLYRAYEKSDDVKWIFNWLAPVLVPAWKALAPGLHEAIPRAKSFLAAVFPELQQQLAAGSVVEFNVQWVQQSLNSLGFPCKTDGVYGEVTHDAVSAYQKSRGIEVDGWAGFETCSHLYLDTHKKDSP